MAERFAVTAPVWVWNGEKGSWHFVTISGEVAKQIRFDSLGMRGGFGSVKVNACLDGVSWTTSIFPSGDDYLLPLKADVRRRARICAGDQINVMLSLA